MNEKTARLSRVGRMLLAISVSMLLVASGMFLLTQLLRSEVSSKTGDGTLGNETLPDLSISSADINYHPPWPIEGDIVFICATVHNIGGAPAYNITVEFWDDIYGDPGGRYLIGLDYLPVIEPGQIGNATVNWDTSGQPGNNTITVIVDPFDMIQESDESNNEASKSIYVEPAGFIDDLPPEVNDVRVNGLPVINVPAGTIVKITATIDDTSTGLSPILNANYTIGKQNWPTSHPMHAVDGSFDEPYELVYSHVNTTGWMIGSYQSWVYGCDWVPNCNITGSYATINIVEGNVTPTVIVIQPNGGEIWTGNQYNIILWKMTDESDPSLRVSIYYSSSGGEPWILITEGTYPIGENNYSWILPGIDTNSARVLICATNTGNMTGCDISDDHFVIDSTRPEILLTIPVDGETNVPLDMPMNVHFSEPMNMASVEDAFFISPNVTGLVFFWIPENLVLDIEHDPFLPNTDYSWGFTCAAKDISSPGNILKNCNVPFHFSTGNGNLTEIDLTLAPEDIHFSDDSPEEGENVMISACIHNIGDRDAYNVDVRFIDWYNDTGTILTEEVIYYIPAGYCMNASYLWVAGPSGNHTIEVIADPYNTIPETNEENNAASRSITVGPGAGYGIFAQATTFDNDNDGKYDDVVILVYDSNGHAVEGASIYIDGIFFGLTVDTGLLIAYNFSQGIHAVLATSGSYSDTTSFQSDG